MGQDICIRKDEKPLGYDWECGHEELYVRVNMYYNGSLYVGLWQKQKECEKKLELFGDLTIGVMGFLRPGQAIISDCGAKAKVAFIEKYKLGKVRGKSIMAAIMLQSLILHDLHSSIQKVRKDICSKMVLIKKNLKQIRVKRYI